jgi:hypothetical protein
MTWWMWYAAGIGTVVAALMLAALVSRWFREPAAHRAGIDEDEDDPEPVPPTYPHRDLYPKHQTRPVATDADWAEAAKYYEDDAGLSLGPPPTYPETSRLLPGPPSGGRRDEELAGGDAETRTRPADESPPPPVREVWKPR